MLYASESHILCKNIFKFLFGELHFCGIKITQPRGVRKQIIINYVFIVVKKIALVTQYQCKKTYCQKLYPQTMNLQNIPKISRSHQTVKIISLLVNLSIWL